MTHGSGDHSVTVYHSSELQGLKGDNGEEWCVFLRTGGNPLNSGWKWCASESEAREFARSLLKVK